MYILAIKLDDSTDTLHEVERSVSESKILKAIEGLLPLNQITEIRITMEKPCMT